MLTLSFSAVILNTDIHNPAVSPPTTQRTQTQYDLTVRLHASMLMQP